MIELKKHIEEARLENDKKLLIERVNMLRESLGLFKTKVFTPT